MPTELRKTVSLPDLQRCSLARKDNSKVLTARDISECVTLQGQTLPKKAYLHLVSNRTSRTEENADKSIRCSSDTTLQRSARQTSWVKPCDTKSSKDSDKTECHRSMEKPGISICFSSSEPGDEAHRHCEWFVCPDFFHTLALPHVGGYFLNVIGPNVLQYFVCIS